MKRAFLICNALASWFSFLFFFFFFPSKLKAKCKSFRQHFPSWLYEMCKAAFHEGQQPAERMSSDTLAQRCIPGWNPAALGERGFIHTVFLYTLLSEDSKSAMGFAETISMVATEPGLQADEGPQQPGQGLAGSRTPGAGQCPESPSPAWGRGWPDSRAPLQIPGQLSAFMVG